MTTGVPVWAELFPNEDYQFRFGIRAGSPQRFFGVQNPSGEMIAERRRWLRDTPAHTLVYKPDAALMVAETVRHAIRWNTVSAEDTKKMPDDRDAPALIRWLGEAWESDFLLLAAPAGGEYVLQAGCVCFPSSWHPEEKLGRPLSEIHDPVPGLNAKLGDRISQFLARIKPDTGWERANWGLSRSPELNQHPTRILSKLIPPFRADDIWVRIEYQIFYRLPETDGVLFGIRLLNLPLPELMLCQSASIGLHRALATMPEPIAIYKNLSQGREQLLKLLSA